MLFKLRLAKPKITILGYQTIEVLGAVPFRFTPVEGAQDGAWVAQSMLMCRTESGLAQICEDDLWSEIEAGVYVEDGKK